MTMKARLEGVLADLEVLSCLFAVGDVRVSHDDEGYYLTAPAIDNPPPETKFYEAAQARLLQLNGLARLDDPYFRPVTLSGKYTDGERQHQVISPKSIASAFRPGRLTVTVTNPDGTVVPGPPSPWPDRVRVAVTDSAVARVLRIMARNDDLDWYDLYKIYEIIRRDVGGQRKLYKRGWTTYSKDRSFKASANRYDVSGDAARHAVDEHAEPAKKTMTIDEGRAYISKLVTRWLDSLV
jgi:hypothetical protein